MIRKLLGWLYGTMRSAYYEERYRFYRQRYQLPPGFRFDGTDIRIYGPGRLVAGDNSYIGTNSTIQVVKDATVTIGHNCRISHNVRIYTANHQPDQDFTQPLTKPPVQGNVSLGNGVWLGANVFVNAGVVIGDNVVVGANSVVTKNLAANGIYGGIPAKLIRLKTDLTL